ncbi:MAG: TOBE domain-containing protein, partial [Pseudomonadota bacterium]|nr:TOBE domain-containing protein [Pseudomonadota bacterium]
EGRVVQIGPPLAVYRNPANTFVASFLGSPPMNLVEASVVRPGVLGLGAQEVGFPAGTAPGEKVLFGVRPEDLYVARPSPERMRAARLTGTIAAVEPLGAETLVVAELPGLRKEITARAGRDFTGRAGDAVSMDVDLDSVRLFDPATGMARAVPGLDS